MSTMIRSAAPARVRLGQLLGARQLADVVRRLAASPADWLGRVRLNPAGRWYERIHLDDSHEVWVISWLPTAGWPFRYRATSISRTRGSCARWRPRPGGARCCGTWS